MITSCVTQSVGVFAYSRVLSSLMVSDDVGCFEISKRCICFVLMPSTFPCMGWIRIMRNSNVFGGQLVRGTRDTDIYGQLFGDKV